MEHFDKQQAIDVIEDALAGIKTSHARGVAVGLCGAFHMCGLLSAEEWEAFLKRIPTERRARRVLFDLRGVGFTVHAVVPLHPYKRPIRSNH